MKNQADCVLLIESDHETAAFVRAAFAEAGDEKFAIEWVRNLHAGLERLSKGGVKAILLNLFLPDMQGIETFNKLYAAESQIPILILSGLDREEVAKRAILGGAQDYLLTGQIDRYSLVRSIRNAVELKLVEDALFIEKERAQVTLNSIGDAVISTDVAGNVTYLNAAGERMTGWSKAEAIGQPFTDVFRIVDGVTHETLPNPMESAIQQNKPVGLSMGSLLIRRDGVETLIEDSAAPILDRSGRVSGAVIVFHDATEARSTMLKMSHFAQHDYLTGLPNRLLLNDRLNQEISQARRNRQQFALLFLDVDRFKNINDSLGHAIGDQLLQSIAQRLIACVRDSDTVSRHGGDEFVVLLSDIKNTEVVGYSAAKILASLAEKFTLAEYALHVTMSMGISVFPGDGEDGETLFQHADAALHHAKEGGRNNFRFFTQHMNDRATERQALEGSLRLALLRKEFVLHYQPKVNLRTGEITGAEALIRWQHPALGLLSPNKFVAIAEDSGLIVPIGQWVLREACRQAQAWQNSGIQPIPIAVNVSSLEFRGENFLADIRDILADTGLDPQYLKIELSESVLVQDVDLTLTVLKALKALGIRLAIDDFGTGYSSLSYLQQFPVDTLKIDQSFVQDIAAGNGNAAIVNAVIGLGNSLKLGICAEGVETREQLNFLRASHCEEGQGFYFSPALDAQAFGELRGPLHAGYVVN